MRCNLLRDKSKRGDRESSSDDQENLTALIISIDKHASWVASRICSKFKNLSKVKAQEF